MNNFKKLILYASFFSFILIVFIGCSEENEPNLIEPLINHEFLASINYPWILSNGNSVSLSNNGKASRDEGVLTIANQGGGSAYLVRNDNGISVQTNSTGLTSGNAYTAWFLVFEQGFPPIVVHAAGHIVGNSGNLSFGGHLSLGDVGAVNGTDILGNGSDGSFDDPGGSLVWIHVVDHGPAGVDGPGTIPENIHEITGLDGLAQEYVFAP